MRVDPIFCDRQRGQFLDLHERCAGFPIGLWFLNYVLVSIGSLAGYYGHLELRLLDRLVSSGAFLDVVINHALRIAGLRPVRVGLFGPLCMFGVLLPRRHGRLLVHYGRSDWNLGAYVGGRI